MIRQSIAGFRRALFPGLTVVFLFLLSLSIGEALYQTKWGTLWVYCLLAAAFFVISCSILFCVAYSCDYCLVQDVLIVRQYLYGREKQHHVIRLRAGGVRCYRGLRRIFGMRPGRRVYRCYIPFFGGARKASILFTDDNGKDCKIVFKPSADLLSAVERILAAPPQA